jgi:mycofactocin precursor
MRGGPVPEQQSEAVQSSSDEDAVVEETLVEEVSIDGMCGVY